MAKRGNPNIRKLAFTSETARAAAKKSRISQKNKCSMFKAVRALIDDCAPKVMLKEGVVRFWEMHGVEENQITSMMAELTPIYIDALNNHDLDSLERIYKMLGLTFDSTKEQNVKLAFDNPLETKSTGELVINIVEKKPEPINIPSV